MKKTVLIIFVVISLNLLFADGVQPEGNGTENNPYQISTLDNLLWLSTNPDSWDSHFIQTSDIDASDTENWNVGAGFSPIGSYEDSFTGTYDGGNFEIQNLYIVSTDRFVGFFGSTENASLSNINLENIICTGSNRVGALIANCHQTEVSNCSTNVILEREFIFYHIFPSFDCGGLIGVATDSFITNCSSEGTINQDYQNSSVSSYVGGLIANSDSNEIENCSSSCYVTSLNSSSYSGGLIGKDSGSTISECQTNSTHVESNGSCGGLLYEGYNSSIESCYSTSDLTGYTVGGIASLFRGDLSNSYFAGTIQASRVGVLFRKDFFADVNITNSYYDYENTMINGETLIDIGAITHNQFTQWLENDINLDINDFLSASGDYYLVGSEENFINMLPFVYDNYNFRLIDDIDLADNNGINLPYFKGVLDGDEYSIFNVSISSNQLLTATGFINNLQNATISNLSIDNANITAGNNVGILAGTADSTQVTNCFTSGEVTSEYKIGGLIGLISYSAIDNCHTSSSLTGVSMVYSLISQLTFSNVTNCSATGSIVSSLPSFGFMKKNYYDSLQNSYYNYETTTMNGEHRIERFALPDNLFNDWLENDMNLNISDYYSSDGNNYLIEDAIGFKNLMGFSDNSENSFKLTADIDLNDYPNLYIPVLNADFDGNGFSILNLYLGHDFDSSSFHIGCFGEVNEVSLSNLGLVNAIKGGYFHGGALAGKATNSQISNCYVRGATGNVSNYAGLIGESHMSDISYCYSAIEYLGTENFPGLIGTFINSTINSSFWDNEIAGANPDDYSLSTTEMQTLSTYINAGWDFINETENGTDDNWVFVPNNYPFLRTNSQSANFVIQPIEKHFGFLMINETSNFTFTLTNNGSSSYTIEEDNIYIEGDDSEDFILTDTNEYPIELSIGESVEITVSFAPQSSGLKNANLTIIDNITRQTHLIPLTGRSLNGLGVEDSPFIISSLEDLQVMYRSLELWDNHYSQTVDIDASGMQNWNIDFEGIGNSNVPFSGSYDGNNHTITNLTISNSGSGFFRRTESALIENIHIIDANIYSLQPTYFVGTLIGYDNNSEINNCSATGVLNGIDYVGGLVGSARYSSINNSYSDVDVSGNEYVAGLVGYMHGSSSEITNSYSMGNISGNNNISGLVNYNMIQNETPQNEAPQIVNSFYDYQSVLINGEHRITTRAVTSEVFDDWLENNLEIDINNFFDESDGHYQISTITDMKNMLGFAVSDYDFVLQNDLDFSLEGDFFVPNFIGSFDGNSHTISNVSISSLQDECTGFFEIIENSEITNLNIENISIDGEDYIGGLLSLSFDSTIENCHLSGIINGEEYVGGLAGSVSNSFIDNCSSDIEINLNNFVGGLVCISDESTISNSYATSEITAINSTCGLLVAGLIDSSVVENCYADGDLVISNHSFFKGLIGVFYLNSLDDYSIVNSYYNYEDVTVNGKSYPSYYGINSDQFNDWLDNDMSIAINDYLENVNGVYQISTTDDLTNILPFVYDNSIDYELISDLDLNSVENFMIPILRSEFEGNNYSISNLNINLSDTANIGFIRELFAGQICNLTIENASIFGKDRVGGFCGGIYPASTIDNCSIYGEIRSSGMAGGIVAETKYTQTEDIPTIINCNNYADINAIQGAGIIAGAYTINIEKCNNYGTIVSLYAGGICSWGNENTSVIECANYADFFTRGWAAGILMSGDDVLIDRCYNMGNIISEEGVVEIGGIASHLNNSIVRNCYNHGNIIAPLNYAGGIVGRLINSLVNRCYSTGEMFTESGIGGGIVGDNDSGTVNNSFWDMETSGIDYSYDGTGKTTAEMKDLATYTNTDYLGLENPWDFVGNPFDDNGNENIWHIDQNVNNGYPFLTEENQIFVLELIPEAGEIDLEEGQAQSFSVAATTYENSPLSYSWKLDDEEVETLFFYDFVVPQNPAQTYNLSLTIFSEENRERTYRDSLILNWTINIVNDANEDAEELAKTELFGNYPNPFNPTTTISFHVKENEKADLKIFNIKGQLVKSFEEFESGNHKVLWNSTDNNDRQVASGIYFYRLENDKYKRTKKLLMLK